MPKMAPPEGVAIVTGGTSYLGAAAARSLALTHAVAITDLEGQEAEGRKLVAELGEDRAVFLACDVRSEESIASAFKAATDHFKLPLTTLVNNAAVIPLGDPTKKLDATDMQEFDDIFAVNCRGAWLCTQAAARLMQPQRKGSIINVGTVAAINRALPFEDASYGVSKFALRGMTEVAACRLAAFSIRVNTISPTAIADSPLITNACKANPMGPEVALQMTHTLFAPLHPGQLPTASAYGDAVEFLAGPKSLHITGINLPLDQGWAAGAFNMPG